jgi:hypothetical protein
MNLKARVLPLQRRTTSRGSGGQLQVMELAPGMRPAAHLCDLLLCIAHELLVATEVIHHQRASPFIQERFGVCPRSAFTKDVRHSFDVFVRSCRIRPQIRPVRFAFARLEHLHRGFVCVQRAAAQNVALQSVHQRLQPHPAVPTIGPVWIWGSPHQRGQISLLVGTAASGRQIC